MIDKKIRYSGITIFFNEETYYDFDGELINLYVDTKKFFDLTTIQIPNGGRVDHIKSLDFDYLDCGINGTNNRVIFSFDKKQVKTSLCINSNTQVISLNVHDYIEYSKNVQNNKDLIIVYYSKNLMKSLDLLPFYKCDFTLKEDNIIANVILNRDACRNVSHVEIENYKVEMYPTFKSSWSGCYFDFTPGIELKIRNVASFGIDIISKFCHTFIAFVKYIFMRDSIMPESLEVKCNGKNGIFGSTKYAKQEIEDEKHNDVFSSFMYWNNLYNVAGNIFKAIYENDIFLDNLPKKRIERIVTSNNSITYDCAAFEFEFRKYYPSGRKRHRNTIVIENKVRNKLQELINSTSGKEKNYYRNFLKHLSQETLQGNIKYMFEKFGELFTDIKNKLKLHVSFQLISEECAGMRNTIDHGKKDRQITRDIAGYYVLLRALIYAMQLQRLGLDNENLRKCIFSLLNIKELGILLF